ncbi:hypothetical protein CHS0354_007091 [Potamilus streckersoni]|uniref:Uncharacterized protein n=1 Tax=Potamilus streckersoni TaxID=2493646 RepID=A0AAE0TBB1_9BIVA|nr:hypothetical protein CHS0354_007091 [Potamilus streckersoni]
MACSKRHPFMKNVLNNLHSFYYFANEHDSTGPRFLTYLFREYSKEGDEKKLTDNTYVYLTPPEYFNPTADPGLNSLLSMQSMLVRTTEMAMRTVENEWMQCTSPTDSSDLFILLCLKPDNYNIYLIEFLIEFDHFMMIFIKLDF